MAGNKDNSELPQAKRPSKKIKVTYQFPTNTNNNVRDLENLYDFLFTLFHNSGFMDNGQCTTSNYPVRKV